ncbi:hypothetical protein OO013_08900 [Mangrovivirga sp. M17]|uniref:Phospholipase/carboxylesterase/thioesterase domain-containing protein n=1 Tax=Mangrovivirga halotolerans TaxID=2993936 RepID=A0ABT3RS31_9BACT|nr:hypothetical protein [Mangrovivirga halotolerans]MCX2743980.1 hypothetical protein [Mangrovivirga halotolerans]
MSNQFSTVDFSFEAPYLVRGKTPKEAKRIWILFHGYGQNIEFFSKKFQQYEKSDCLIIPQGLSLFYLDNKYRKVGASWLTKEYREYGRKNQINYIHQIIKKELGDIDPNDKELIIFGFSQGVATASRVVSELNLKPDHLIFYAGNPAHDISFPLKLKPNTQVHFVYGDKDEYITEENATKIIDYIKDLTKITPEVMRYQGLHTINSSILGTIITS